MNILEEVGINIRCAACSGEYQVPLQQVLVSHEMLHDGCPVTEERECPPLHWSRLFHEQLLREFQQNWSRLEDAARASGGELMLLGRVETRTGPVS